MKFGSVEGGGRPEVEINKELEQRIEGVVGEAEEFVLSLLIKEFPSLDEGKVREYMRAYESDHLQRISKIGDIDEMFDFDGFGDFFFKREMKLDKSGPFPPSIDEVFFRKELDSAIEEILEDPTGTGFDRIIQGDMVSMRLELLRSSLRSSFAEVIENKRANLVRYLAAAFMVHGSVPSKVRLLIPASEYKELEEKIKGEEAQASNSRILAKVFNSLEQRDTDIVEADERMRDEGVHPYIAAKITQSREDKEAQHGSDKLEQVENMIGRRIAKLDELVAMFDDPRDIYDWVTQASAAEALVNEALAKG